MGVWRGALVVAGMLCATCGVAQAAPVWLAAQTIEPGHGALSAVACASATMCAAAGPVPVITDGGPAFEPATNPDPSATLTAVSCAPGTRLCMFVDGSGGAFAYDSGSFTSRTSIDASTELQSVSCPTASFCMAIDHDSKVLKFSLGSWGAPTTLGPPSGFTNRTAVSCVSPSFCLALASTTTGEQAYTFNGTSWTPLAARFDSAGGAATSLTCTSATFCVETSDAGNASVYSGGSTWSTTTVDTTSATPKLSSSCASGGCVAVDAAGNAYTTATGLSWTPNDPANITAGTGIGVVHGVACVTSALCVAVDASGSATTYAPAPNAGAPALTGSANPGDTLTLAPASIAESSVWRTYAWRRCDSAGASCSSTPISTSPSSYTLTADDQGKYVDVLETVGFAFRQEGPLASNVIGPVGGSAGTTSTPGGTGSTGQTTQTTQTATGDGTITPGTVRLTATRRATHGGIVVIRLRCTGGPCRGKLTVTVPGRHKHDKPIATGSARYAIAAGRGKTLRIQLRSSRAPLHIHSRRIGVRFTLAPAGGKARRGRLTLTVRG